jgi:archaemetzincin
LAASIRVVLWSSLILCFGCAGGSHPAANEEHIRDRAVPPAELKRAMVAIEPFFQPMGSPAAYDWLASHKEPGQTFEEYINENPTLPTAERRVIYILPLGKLDPAQKKVIELTAKWLQAFYGLPVRSVPLQRLPEPLHEKNFRKSPTAMARQVRTGFILDDVLAPQLPADAAAMIALTDEDLYPDESMNFVFGQASFDKRVGVWSLYRLNDKSGPRKFLERTLKIAAHETGHMFSMRHCTKYECVMSGSNYLGETDRHPLDACPECMAKIAWLSKTTPSKRYRELADFCTRNGLTAEADEFKKKLAAVGQ